MVARKTPTASSDETSTAIGLCARCRHHLRQGTKRGAIFHRCGLADEDDRFTRYPPLPVVACPGFATQETTD